MAESAEHHHRLVNIRINRDMRLHSAMNSLSVIVLQRFLRRSAVGGCLIINSAIALGLLACAHRDNEGVRGSPVSSEFKVALLTPGPISDQSWNGGAYAGLMKIKDSLGAQVSHIQTKTPADFEENFRQYGAGGYSLVFGHGFEFQDVAERVARDYPKTFFVTTGGRRSGPNLAAMEFSFDEPSFLAGMVAAAVSRSGIIGCIGGTELPPVKSSFSAFEAGARAMNVNARVIVSYIGNWDDASAGKEQALALMSRGVDVIFQNADAAGLGAFQAAREKPGRWIIGSNGNQNEIVPTVTLGSVVIDLPLAFMTVARKVRNGTVTGGIIRLDTRSQVVRWLPSRALTEVLPDLARKKVDSVQALMLAHRFARSAEAPVGR